MTRPFLTVLEYLRVTLPTLQCAVARPRLAAGSRLPLTFGTMHGARTVVPSLAVLLPGPGSGDGLATTNETVIGPACEVFTTTPTTVLRPAGSDCRRQVTTAPAALQGPMPSLAVPETKVTLDGSVAVSVGVNAAAGPALATVARYVTLSPTKTASGKAVTVTERSASGGEDVEASHVTVGWLPAQKEPDQESVPVAVWRPVNVPLTEMSLSPWAVYENESFVIGALMVRSPVRYVPQPSGRFSKLKDVTSKPEGETVNATVPPTECVPE
jgi:hypothetical protein